MFTYEQHIMCIEHGADDVVYVWVCYAVRLRFIWRGVAGVSFLFVFSCTSEMALQRVLTSYTSWQYVACSDQKSPLAWCYIHCVSKNVNLDFWLWLGQMYTDFKNSFTIRFPRKLCVYPLWRVSNVKCVVVPLARVPAYSGPKCWGLLCEICY